MGPEVTADVFQQRLVALCVGSERIFPKKTIDRHVMLAAASRDFERGMIYTEEEVNGVIERWLNTGCPSLLIDEVTVRRELIDAAYLMRDDAGRFYAVGPGSTEVSFSPDVADVDPIAVVENALEERASRKRARET